MKNITRLYNILVIGVLTMLMVGCVNDLNAPDNGGSTTLTSPVIQPDLISWSGEQTFRNTFDGTNNVINSRAGDEDSSNSNYNYNWPSEMSKAENIVIPEDAKDYNEGGFKNDSGETDIVYLPGDKTYEWISLGSNNNLVLYVGKGATLKNISTNHPNVELYICDGGTVTFDNAPSNGSWNIYNNGTLNFPNGIGVNINNIYNDLGNIYVGNKDNVVSLDGKVSIYSKGGYIEWKSKTEIYEYWSNMPNIDGTIISDNIVKFDCGVKFQSSGTRDICHLICEDLIEITDGTNIFGEIKGPNLKFDGATVKLHPNGLIDITGTISLVNSASYIYAADGSKGYVKSGEFVFENENDFHRSFLNDGDFYFKVDGKIDMSGVTNAGANTGIIYNSFEEYLAANSSDESLFVEEITVTPACGSEPDPGPGPGTHPDPKPEPQISDDDHVEINLALNDVHTLFNSNIPKYGIEDLVTKLSIHVRYPRDVEVIIPVPESIYCDQDDIYILKDHYYQENGDPNWVYGGDVLTWENGVGGQTVSLSVQFVPASNDLLTQEGKGYIRVWTEGINNEVIHYCHDYFGDGINFEVYNYYNRETMYGEGNYEKISYDELQWKYLSRSFVNFDWQNSNKEYPCFYVNAFNELKESDPNYNAEGTPDGFNRGDCYVWIMGDPRANYNQDTYKLDGYITREGTSNPAIKWQDNERSNFRDGRQWFHYNFSHLNWIYDWTGWEKTHPKFNMSQYTSSSFPFSRTDDDIIERVWINDETLIPPGIIDDLWQ